MNIQPQDCYLPVDEDSKKPFTYLMLLNGQETQLLEKRTGMIVLTEAELEEIKKKERSAGYQEGVNWSNRFKIAYLNQLLIKQP